MTQIFVDRYMEDDIVYRIVGFVQDNIKLILSFFLTGVAAFISGKIYGIRTQSVIFGLKEKYANIEQQKKKLRKQMQFLSWFDTLIKKLIYIVLGVGIALLLNIIYHRGFDYSIILANTLSRNILFALFAVVIVLFFGGKLVRRYNNSLKKHFLTIDMGTSEIGDRLIQSLGPELTFILKAKLLVKSVNTKNIAIQTIREQKEKTPVVNEFPEKEAFAKKIVELENVRLVLMKELEKNEINKQILKKDLNHYQNFLQKIREFEWCENCLQYAERPEEIELKAEEDKDENKENIEEKGEKREKDEKDEKEEKDDINSPEKTHPAIEEKENEKPKADEEQKESKDKESGDSVSIKKEPCTNDCLKKYFEVGFEISEEFNKEEAEIRVLRERYKSINILN